MPPEPPGWRHHVPLLLAGILTREGDSAGSSEQLTSVGHGEVCRLSRSTHNADSPCSGGPHTFCILCGRRRSSSGAGPWPPGSCGPDNRLSRRPPPRPVVGSAPPLHIYFFHRTETCAAQARVTQQHVRSSVGPLTPQAGGHVTALAGGLGGCREAFDALEVPPRAHPDALAHGTLILRLYDPVTCRSAIILSVNMNFMRAPVWTQCLRIAYVIFIPSMKLFRNMRSGSIAAKHS